MRIGIIGAGRIGATAARLFARAGHDVAISNSRGPASLADLVAEIDEEVGQGRVHAATVEDASEHGEVVLLAVPWIALGAAVDPKRLGGRIVIDAMNPYGEDGSILETGEDGSSGLVAKALPSARLVKAFNTIHWAHLAEQGDARLPMMRRRVIPIAGDDTDAKHVVAGLIEQLGFAPLDMGQLIEGGRRQQPETPIYNRTLTLEQAATMASGPR
jgi:8-hydroxy-5-deazaflavin:NADPH oxidoreductase